MCLCVWEGEGEGEGVKRQSKQCLTKLKIFGYFLICKYSSRLLC